jgi:multiple sugar transport system substrate-binding protein
MPAQTSNLPRTLLAAALLLAAPAVHAPAAHAADVVFLSTQLRPIEAAQNMREIILKGAPTPTAFVTEDPPTLSVRIKAEMTSGKRTVSLIGALHGELQPLVTMGALVPLDALAAKLVSAGIPAEAMKAGQFDAGHQMYIPWMQANYIMVANKQALPHLPAGADINALTYDQLAQWGANIQKATGKRMIGFPAGPKGLMHRFFEGFLLPSYTGGVVSTYKSPEAEAMWTAFAGLWKTVNPNSTSYNFMQEPLMAGDVWIGFDHVARMLDALRARPDDFVAFPAPAGPKGRGHMPVMAGLAVAADAPDSAGAQKVIEYLLTPATQIATARALGFFPTVRVDLPPDLDPGLKLAVAAIQATGAAKDARLSQLPIGLGAKGGEFDKVFLDTFQLIVLRGQAPKTVLARQGAEMQRVMNETGAPCWSPDPAGAGPCQVK